MNISEALATVRSLFIDSAPVIYHVENNPSYQALTDVVFRHISNGGCEAVTSPVTLAECLVRPYQLNDIALTQRFVDVITRAAHTTYASLDATAQSAAELRARYNLTLTDAFQIAAAIKAGCDAFLTNDSSLKRVRELTILVLDELEV